MSFAPSDLNSKFKTTDPLGNNCRCQISSGKSLEFSYIGYRDLNAKSVMEIKQRV